MPRTTIRQQRARRSIPAWARPVFAKTAEPSRVGWCMLKNGKPHGTPCTTKRSLLIGYDMIPLLGLRKMERRLESKGITAHRMRVVACPSSTVFCAAVGGVLDLKAAEWSVCCDYVCGKVNRAAVTFRGACGWMRAASGKVVRFDLSESQAAALGQVWMGHHRDSGDCWSQEDRRRTPTFERYGKLAVEAFLEHGVTLVPCEFVKV